VLDVDGFGGAHPASRSETSERADVTRALSVSIAAAALAALAVQPADPASAAGSCDAQSSAVETALAAKLVELVNAHRRSLGLRTVRPGAALGRSAVWKARQMARNGYVSHTDLPGRRTLAQRLRSCGFGGSGWGEVLAAGQRWPSAVLRAWLRSASHRAVIEAPWWRYAGAGVARSQSGGLYWALDFGA
jgi:uncharacterized protein YkwD